MKTTHANHPCESCPARTRSSFSYLKSEECDEIDRLRTYKEFAKAQELPMNASSPPKQLRGFYCIRQGHVQVTTFSPKSNRNTLRICGPGDLVGYGGWETTIVDPHAAYALGEVSACFFPASNFLAAQNKFPNIATGIAKMLLRIINIKDRRIVGLENHSAKNRVASLFLSLVEKFGESSKHGSKINVELDRKTMAVLAGTVVETFSRIITDLENEKVILRDRRKIHVLNKKHLKRIAET